MTVKILGVSCPKCKILEARVKNVALQYDIPCEVQKVTDLSQIMSYGVMMTPGLVINERLKSAGAIPGDVQILQWLREV